MKNMKISRWLCKGSTATNRSLNQNVRGKKPEPRMRIPLPIPKQRENKQVRAFEAIEHQPFFFPYFFRKLDSEMAKLILIPQNYAENLFISFLRLEWSCPDSKNPYTTHIYSYFKRRSCIAMKKIVP